MFLGFFSTFQQQGSSKTLKALEPQKHIMQLHLKTKIQEYTNKNKLK